MNNLYGIVGAIAILYGGGQIATANITIGMFAEKLLQLGFQVYGVHKSFLGLVDEACYERFSLKKARSIQSQIGTYLSTCRKVDPASEEYFAKIIKTLEKFNIHTIILPGGDGSSRAARDFVIKAYEANYPVQIIFVPCTIDGIPNSETIGFASAVEETLAHVLLMTVNSLATWHPDFATPRIPIIEIQGRNRNDIATEVVKTIKKGKKIGKYNVKDINFIYIPAAYDWTISSFLDRVFRENKETVVVIAEGAMPSDIFWDAIKGKGSGEKVQNILESTKKKQTNLNIVGYLSQTNDCITDEEIKKIDIWTSFAINALLYSRDSVAVIKNGKCYSTMPIDDFADQTDSKHAIPISREDAEVLKEYLL